MEQQKQTREQMAEGAPQAVIDEYGAQVMQLASGDKKEFITDFATIAVASAAGIMLSAAGSMTANVKGGTTRTNLDFLVLQFLKQVAAGLDKLENHPEDIVSRVKVSDGKQPFKDMDFRDLMKTPGPAKKGGA